METPLRKIRKARGETLRQVSDAIGLDIGSLSRVERGKQRPALEVAEKLVAWSEGKLTEIHILYPERFVPATSQPEPA